MRVAIVIPTYNEAPIIATTIAAVVSYCRAHISNHDWYIIVADNGSTDGTIDLVARSSLGEPRVVGVQAVTRGKGAGIRTGWQSITADVYCFIDADLATDLNVLLAFISGIADGADVVVGSRHHAMSHVLRPMSRRLISLVYRLVAWLLLGTHLTDTPCGCKAINQRVKDDVMSLVQDNGWFFDSELVLLAERRGYQIKEIPVSWQERRAAEHGSRVIIHQVAWAYLRHLWRLRQNFSKL